MASPVYTSIPTEEKARVRRFAEQLREKLLPLASTYRYQALLRLLDHDPIPKSPGVNKEGNLGLEDSRQAGSDALPMQANRLFQEWKKLSIDLLADKDSQSESIIYDETARLKKEIEARAMAPALTDTVLSSRESTRPDTSWLDKCMAHRNAWRPAGRISRQNSELPPPLAYQANEADSVSAHPPSIRHPHRAPFSPINGQLPIANHGGLTGKRQSGSIDHSRGYRLR